MRFSYFFANRWWKSKRKRDGEEDTGHSDGWAALLAVQLLWAMFMGGRCLTIGLRQRLGAGGPLDLLAVAAQ